MEITVTEYKRVAVVQPKGPVDSVTAPELEAALVRLAQAGKHNLVLDFSQVEFLSSAGLRVLVATLKAARQSGGELCLACPSPRIAKALRLAGVDTLLTVYDSREAAVGSF
jgi:anti-sigma B factor antagonist